MKFCDIMLCCGVLCILNAICLAIALLFRGGGFVNAWLLLVLTVLR